MEKREGKKWQTRRCYWRKMSSAKKPTPQDIVLSIHTHTFFLATHTVLKERNCASVPVEIDCGTGRNPITTAQVRPLTLEVRLRPSHRLLPLQLTVLSRWVTWAAGRRTRRAAAAEPTRRRGSARRAAAGAAHRRPQHRPPSPPKST